MSSAASQRVACVGSGRAPRARQLARDDDDGGVKAPPTHHPHPPAPCEVDHRGPRRRAPCTSRSRERGLQESRDGAGWWSPVGGEEYCPNELGSFGDWAWDAEQPQISWERRYGSWRCDVGDRGRPPGVIPVLTRPIMPREGGPIGGGGGKTRRAGYVGTPAHLLGKV